MFSLKSIVPTAVFESANSRNPAGPVLSVLACFSDKSTNGVSDNLADADGSAAAEELTAICLPMRPLPQNSAHPATTARANNTEIRLVGFDIFAERFTPAAPSVYKLRPTN